jgi:hypothetical protein
LTESAAAVFAKSKVRFTLVPSSSFNVIKYFAEDYAADCEKVLAPTLQYVPPDQGLDNLDVVIFTAHGSDLSPLLWDVRRKIGQHALVVAWLWDNHLSHTGNLRTAMASDFVFPSHKYVAGYLIAPMAVLGKHVPSCCAQWRGDEVAGYFEEFQQVPRSNKLLVNYVDYPFSPRTELLRHLGTQMPEANVLLMNPNERTRYFGKSRADRFKEWMEHKSTLILPVDRDLSTRIFDALLAGQILLVPNIVADFDEVIPPAKQVELGVIKLQSLSIVTLRQATADAVRIFDEKGIEGVRARHRYVLDNHMMVHRLGTMLDGIKEIATRQTLVVFDGNTTMPYGLHLVRPS